MTADLARAVVTAAKQARVQIITAESCTGGMLAAALTDIAGASEVCVGGFVSYANPAKIDMLGVPVATLNNYGAVSGETALAMAEGAVTRAINMLGGKSPVISLAITGIAGPGGGSGEKPVGLVWFGLAATDKPARAESVQFGGGREAIRAAAVQHGLGMLLAALGR